ncbi:MAG: TolC family protein [Aquabacterium sp.]|nr:MAG: TolC family protein [Aquabacterium sp.]
MTATYRILLAARPRARLLALAAAAVLFTGCASTAVNQNLDSTAQFSRQHLGAEVRWLQSDEARAQAQADVDARLAQPLSADDAVQIALAYSPALQAMLYDSAADAATATQGARLPNPVFAFEKLVRKEAGARELEIGRVLSFSVLDLLLWPSRLRVAEYQQQATRLTLAGNVVDVANSARAAWVNAVAAEQSLTYFRQVKATADAGAELAKRMQAAGNYSRLQRAREQAFSADAVAQLARAQQSALATREALVRVLGLTDAQAAALKLPPRLPDLPPAPRDEASVQRTGLEQRLDVQLSRVSLDFLAREQGLSRITSLVNGLEVGVVRNSESGLPPQRGYELAFPLPLFDFGDAGRTRTEATYMAALNRTAQVAVEANSRVREQYGAYRTAYDVARHYRDEIVPLRKAISDENVLRYNAMLIGVFELLADSREQITSVVQAIEAQRDFWLADAALQAALVGRPIDTGTPAASSTRSADGGAPTH